MSKLDPLSKSAMLDELWSLGEVTVGQVEKLATEFSPEVVDSAERLQNLEESAPTKGRILRGSLIGAATGPIASLAWRAAAGSKARAGLPINLGKRVHMANAAHGAIFGGLMPAAQHKLETSVEKKHLINKLKAEMPDASLPT